MAHEELTIISGGYEVTGWKEVRLTRGIERFPSDFDVLATEKYPGTPWAVLQPGQPCEVRLGGELVLTGYLDRVSPFIAAGKSGVHISGRSKPQDLIDCSAHILQNLGTINRSTLVSLAQQLAAPFNVLITDRTAQTGVAPIEFDTFNVNVGESAYEILERVARSVGVLVYDDVDGNVVLSRVDNTGDVVQGIAEGINVQSANASFSMDQRYSHYMVFPTTVDTQGDVRQQLSAGSQWNTGDSRDIGVSRFRPLYIVSEQFQNGQSLAQARADWENNRRWGRSQSVRVTVDSWRDARGKLWTPNTRVFMNLPGLYLSNKEWVLAEVTYLRSLQTGTIAELTLMPAQAFAIQPITLTPFNWDQAQALAQSAPTAPPAGANGGNTP